MHRPTCTECGAVPPRLRPIYATLLGFRLGGHESLTQIQLRLRWERDAKRLARMKQPLVLADLSGMVRITSGSTDVTDKAMREHGHLLVEVMAPVEDVADALPVEEVAA